MSEYKVFYNPDCQKYGVQKLITDYMGTRWHQVLTRKQQCYTRYEKVAERWLEDIKKNGEFHY